MQIYLVGGAVRDRLLGRAAKDSDWVVTGATPEQMAELGFRPVGKDFPVFLHPETSEEYALARTERKTSKGYHGFSFNASEEVTLEEDLERRDLTINAIAEDADGNIVDPYQGKADIEQRILRHVSEAFAEDPVRVLRVARFAARFHDLGFTIAEETMQLMRAMVKAGEVDALVAERVWQETDSALGEDHPEVFFEVLRECGALKILYPEIDRLWGVPQPEVHHPEIDTGVHTMMVLQQACLLSTDKEVRFAALTHDLGKGTTEAEILPHHYGHEERGVGLLDDVCARFKIPKRYADLAKLNARYHTHVHKAFELTPKKLLKVLNTCDIYRKPERFEQILLTCEADSRGRTGYEQSDYPQRLFYQELADVCRGVDVKAIIEEGFTGVQVKEKLHQRRMSAAKIFRKQKLAALET